MHGYIDLARGVDVKVDRGSVIVQRTRTGKRVAGESAFWVMLKRSLQSKGHNVIKKEMIKDGHMVSVGIYYVRSRNMAKPDAFAIWDSSYAVRDVAKDFNSGGPVTLSLKRPK